MAVLKPILVNTIDTQTGMIMQLQQREMASIETKRKEYKNQTEMLEWFVSRRTSQKSQQE